MADNKNRRKFLVHFLILLVLLILPSDNVFCQQLHTFPQNFTVKPGSNHSFHKLKQCYYHNANNNGRLLKCLRRRRSDHSRGDKVGSLLTQAVSLFGGSSSSSPPPSPSYSVGIPDSGGWGEMPVVMMEAAAPPMDLNAMLTALLNQLGPVGQILAISGLLGLVGMTKFKGGIALGKSLAVACFFLLLPLILLKGLVLIVLGLLIPVVVVSPGRRKRLKRNVADFYSDMNRVEVNVHNGEEFMGRFSPEMEMDKVSKWMLSLT